MSATNSLIDKYCRMDNQMDTVRRKISETCLEIQQRQASLERLLQERQSLQELEIRTLAQQNPLEECAQQSLESLHVTQRQLSLAQKSHEAAKSLFKKVTQHSRDYREEFMCSSRSFRSLCQRFLMERDILRLSVNIPLQAYAIVKEKSLAEFFPEEEEQKDEEEDETYVLALQEIKSLESSLTNSKENSKNKLQEIELLERRRDKRQTQQANLESQLGRLQGDVPKLQTELKSLQQKQQQHATAGRSQLGPTLTIERTSPMLNDLAIPSPRCGNRPQPTAAIRNPYTKTNTPVIHQRKRKTNQSFSKNIHSNSQDQYPHRVGRVRTSRDFGLSLRISAQDESSSDDDDDGLLNYVAFRK